MFGMFRIEFNNHEVIGVAKLSDIHEQDFSDIKLLIDVFRASGHPFHIFDEDGTSLNAELAVIWLMDGKVENMHIVIEDGERGVLKKYLIERINSKKYRLFKRFSYKNPYQMLPEFIQNPGYFFRSLFKNKSR
ncbi:hypothetical protein [Niveispirillum sp. KHB5.9]|uniref:hypothetical protein n=1 Tax=Niveispirillum sp. KHB5.9 TaxID=3400269 RepID=UPI003A8C7925